MKSERDEYPSSSTTASLLLSCDVFSQLCCVPRIVDAAFDTNPSTITMSIVAIAGFNAVYFRAV